MELEATALPTEPKPLPFQRIYFFTIILGEDLIRLSSNDTTCSMRTDRPCGMRQTTFIVVVVVVVVVVVTVVNEDLCLPRQKQFYDKWW